MKVRLLAAISTIGMVLIGDPVKAQDDKENEKPSTVEQVISLAAAIEGVRDKKDDTVEDDAGEIEAAIMSAAAMRSAASTICKDLNGKLPRTITGLYLVTEADLKNARRAGVLLAQIELMTTFFNSYRSSGTGSVMVAGEQTRGFIPAIGAATQLLTALLRNDDSVSAISGTLTEPSILANMMIDQTDCASVLPITFAQDVIGNQSAADSSLSKIKALDQAYQAFLGRLGAKPTEGEEQIKAGYQTFIAGLTTSEDGTTALEVLIRAGGLWTTLSSDGTIGILRLSVDKSGGTLLKRKNLWTALGARSLAVTAGIVVSYRVSTSNGKALKAGTVYCTTAQKSFVDLHRLAAQRIPANCSN